jgi:hypothetical protein
VKIPFFIDYPDKFVPRLHLGRSSNLTEDQKQLLDAIDILEQKSDLGISVGARAYNMGLVVLALVILTQGPAVLKIVQNWLGHEPPTAQLVTQNEIQH